MESSFSLLPRSPLVDANLLFDYLVWQFCVQADPPIEVPIHDYSYRSATMGSSRLARRAGR
jgi:hypothetical protein